MAKSSPPGFTVLLLFALFGWFHLSFCYTRLYDRMPHLWTSRTLPSSSISAPWGLSLGRLSSSLRMSSSPFQSPFSVEPSDSSYPFQWRGKVLFLSPKSRRDSETSSARSRGTADSSKRLGDDDSEEEEEDANLPFKMQKQDLSYEEMLEESRKRALEAAAVNYELPLLPEGDAIFPGSRSVLYINEMKFRCLFADMQSKFGNRLIRVFINTDTGEILPIGVICKVVECKRMSNGEAAYIIEAVQRARVSKLVTRDPYVTADVHVMDEGFAIDENIAPRPAKNPADQDSNSALLSPPPQSAAAGVVGVSSFRGPAEGFKTGIVERSALTGSESDFDVSPDIIGQLSPDALSKYAEYDERLAQELCERIYSSLCLTVRLSRRRLESRVRRIQSIKVAEVDPKDREQGDKSTAGSKVGNSSSSSGNDSDSGIDNSMSAESGVDAPVGVGQGGDNRAREEEEGEERWTVSEISLTENEYELYEGDDDDDDDDEEEEEEEEIDSEELEAAAAQVRIPAAIYHARPLPEHSASRTVASSTESGEEGGSGGKGVELSETQKRRARMARKLSLMKRQTQFSFAVCSMLHSPMDPFFMQNLVAADTIKRLRNIAGVFENASKELIKIVLESGDIAVSEVAALKRVEGDEDLKPDENAFEEQQTTLRKVGLDVEYNDEEWTLGPSLESKDDDDSAEYVDIEEEEEKDEEVGDRGNVSRKEALEGRQSSRKASGKEEERKELGIDAVAESKRKNGDGNGGQEEGDVDFWDSDFAGAFQ